MSREIEDGLSFFDLTVFNRLGTLNYLGLAICNL